MKYIDIETKEVVEDEEYRTRCSNLVGYNFRPYVDLYQDQGPLKIVTLTDELLDNLDGTYSLSYDIQDKFADIEVDGKVVTKEQQERECLAAFGIVIPDPTKAPVPQMVEMRQARIALHRAGLLDDIETLIKTLDKEAQLEWEFALTVQRNHPLISIIKQVKGLTDEQIDDMFIEASKL